MMIFIEAMLFVSREAVSVKEIAKIMGIGELYAKVLMDNFTRTFNEGERGLKILEANETYIMATCPSCKEMIEKFINKTPEKTLSNGLLETLTIIAYNQPITRNEIEKIKGKTCFHSLAKLLQLNLIIEAGRKRAVGNPILYKTSDLFLRKFGMTSLSELPKVDSADLLG